MPPYATKSDIEQRYGEDLLFTIWDRENSGLYDEAAIDQALEDASREIDGYLTIRYDVPVVDPVALLTLKKCTIDIAIYNDINEDNLTELRTDRYKKCIAWLKDIARGTISLGIEKPPAGKSGAAFTAQPRRYGRDMGC